MISRRRVEDMERAPSNSTENDNDEQPRVNRCKRKRTTCYRRKSTPSNHNNTRAAGTSGNLLEAPLRAIGLDGHFYECIKCNEVGSLICCDTCACTYHFECLDPPLECAPEGDWFCQNCCEEGNLSDSTVNVTRASSSRVRRRRRTPKRACKVTSGCRLCLNIRKKSIPDENAFFSFKTKSTILQSKSSERGRQHSSTRKDDDGRHSSKTQQNNNVGDKRLILRPRQRGEVSRTETGRSGRRANSSSAQAAETNQNSVNVQLLKRKGRPPGKKRRTSNEQHQQQQQEQQEQQQSQKQPEDLSMVIYGANLLPPEYLAAIRGAEEARRNKAKETPWAGVELDALWVGVRRHGVDNWETLIEDPSLAILLLCKKTSQDLALRWQKELEKMHSILLTSGLFTPPLPLPNVEQQQQPGAIIPNNVQEEEATQQILPPPPQIPVTAITSAEESAPLVPNNHHVPSSLFEPEGEEGHHDDEQILTPEIAVPNDDNQGTSFSPLRESVSVPIRACNYISPLAPEATLVSKGEDKNSTEEQTKKQGPSSSSIAVPTSASEWRPNLNLNPSDNHVLFEAFQQRANNHSQSQIAPPGPSSSSGPPLAIPAQTPIPPPANTDRPKYFFGGLFPVPNRY